MGLHLYGRRKASHCDASRRFVERRINSSEKPMDLNVAGTRGDRNWSSDSEFPRDILSRKTDLGSGTGRSHSIDVGARNGIHGSPEFPVGLLRPRHRTSLAQPKIVQLTAGREFIENLHPTSPCDAPCRLSINGGSGCLAN